MCLLVTETKSIQYYDQDLLTVLNEVIHSWWRQMMESRQVCCLYLAEEDNHEDEEVSSVLPQIGDLEPLPEHQR